MFKHADGALLVVAALLAACGGSSSSPPPPPPERVALYAGMPGRDPAISGGLVDGPRADARFSLGVVIAAGPEGNLYVADIDNHAIRKITPQGVVSTLLVRNVPGEDLRTIAVDSAGVVHFGVATCTDSSDHRTVLACQGAIYRISPTLQAEPVIPLASSDGSTTSLFYPGSLAFDRSGNLYISDQNLTAFTCAVRRLTPAGEISNSPAPCGNLAVSSDGTLYVATGNTVARVVNGTVSVVAGDPSVPYSMHVDGSGASARFAGTGGMAFDAHGDLYVVDAGDSTVSKITPEFKVTTVAGTPTPQLPGIGQFVPGPLPGSLDNPGYVAVIGSDLYVSMAYSIAVVHDVP